MNTTIEALQALYIKLGGALTDTYENIADGAQVGNYTTIPDMIQACTKKAGAGGGSALPAVTADDNDKVLAVVNGAWDKSDAPSGGNDYKVAISTDGQTITVDKSVADIVAAAEADKHVYAKVTVNIGGVIVYQRFELATWGAGVGNYIVTFGAVQEDDDAANPVCIKGENTGGADTWNVV